jgi:hypothetical protein
VEIIEWQAGSVKSTAKRRCTVGVSHGHVRWSKHDREIRRCSVASDRALTRCPERSREAKTRDGVHAE